MSTHTCIINNITIIIIIIIVVVVVVVVVVNIFCYLVIDQCSIKRLWVTNMGCNQCRDLCTLQCKLK